MTDTTREIKRWDNFDKNDMRQMSHGEWVRFTDFDKSEKSWFDRVEELMDDRQKLQARVRGLTILLEGVQGWLVNNGHHKAILFTEINKALSPVESSSNPCPANLRDDQTIRHRSETSDGISFSCGECGVETDEPKNESASCAHEWPSSIGSSLHACSKCGLSLYDFANQLTQKPRGE